MFVRCLIGSVLFLMMLSMPASAQHRPQDFHGILKRECGMEINSQCKGVPDARGQLLACLFTHRATLSPRCEGIMWGSMDSLGKALGRLAQVRRDCDRDERLYCRTVVEGGGHVAACLLLAPRIVSPQCKTTVFSIWDRRRNLN